MTAFELLDLPADEAQPFGSFEAKIGGLLNEEVSVFSAWPPAPRS